jgi:peptidoglycan/xylan/chitin deacetylase (PgdA/CDA1 family)
VSAAISSSSPSLTDRRWARQAIVGLLMLPLSLLPFMAYFKLTPEGRLLWEKFQVALFKPHMPELSPAEIQWAQTHAPHYEGAVSVLVYHGIGSDGDQDGGFSISPGEFGRHLATLKAAGMHVVTARQVAEAFAGKRTLPSNAVVLSFDDGRADALMYADPLLKEAGMRATMFVIAHAAEDPGIYYVGWDKLREYADSGRWDIESHSANSHHEQWVIGDRWLPALTSILPHETISEYTDRVYGDLRVASDEIERHIGKRPVAFAYPFGAHGTERVNDPRLGEILRDAVTQNYALAFDQDDQSSLPLAMCSQDPTSIRRLEVGDWSAQTLIQKIAQAAARTRLARAAC